MRGTIEGELAVEMNALTATIVKCQTQIKLQERKITAAEARGEKTQKKSSFYFF